MITRHKVAIAGLAVALSMCAFPVNAYAVPTQADLDAAHERLEGLGSELSALQDTLIQQEADLQRTQTEIIEKQTQVESTTEELQNTREVLAGRMRSTYKAGGTSILSILMGSNGVEDLISNIYIADKIAAQDAATIQSVQDLEIRLANEVTELEAQKEEEQAVVDATRIQAEEYQRKVEEARAYYESLDEEIQAAFVAQAEAEAQAAAEAAAAGAAQEEPTAQTTAVIAVANAQTSDQGATSDDDETSGNSSSSSSGGGSHVASGGGVSAALALIGSPYVSGAAGPDSFDCSGLVCYVYGYDRGRTTFAMIDSLKASGDWHTNESELNYGDLVFTSDHHVGIYTGNHTMIDAPYPGMSVTQRTIWTSIIGGGPY